MSTGDPRNPGDPDRRELVERVIRVDQAGEYGATRIYAGQLAVLRRNCSEAKLIARMAAQEDRHLARFNALMAERRVRPTALQRHRVESGQARERRSMLGSPPSRWATASVRRLSGLTRDTPAT